MPILFSFRDIQGQIIFFFSTNIEDIDSQHTLKFAPNTLENIDVFSVMTHSKHQKTTDVRFSVHGSPYYKPVKLNGILLRHREEFEKELNINITMVGIDECLYENEYLKGAANS